MIRPSLLALLLCAGTQAFSEGNAAEAPRDIDKAPVSSSGADRHALEGRGISIGTGYTEAYGRVSMEFALGVPLLGRLLRLTASYISVNFGDGPRGSLSSLAFQGAVPLIPNKLRFLMEVGGGVMDPRGESISHAAFGTLFTAFGFELVGPRLFGRIPVGIQLVTRWDVPLTYRPEFRMSLGVGFKFVLYFW